MNAQGSPEWFIDRCGKVTASRISDIMATTKSGPSASRQNYLAQLVAERLTGRVEESYTNSAIAWGIENEPIARAMYELRNGVFVDQVGFIQHPDIDMAGASPDGLVELDGLVEIKCPNTATHIDTLLNRAIPSKYLYQMLWQMECTRRRWNDYVSFDPRMPQNLSLCVIRVEIDEDKTSIIRSNVIKFLDEVDSTLEKLISIS